MRIRWLGHSAFLLIASDGTRIITDPYKPERGIAYGQITESADFATVSHDHFDHNDVAGVPGSPRAIRSPGSHKAGGVNVTGFDCYHDEKHGAQRGRNIIFVFEDPEETRDTIPNVGHLGHVPASRLRVAHLGDLGHVPTEQAKAIGKVDVAMIPVGGFFTIDAAGAHATAELLGARVTIPMHYRTGKVSLPIVGVEEFIGGDLGHNPNSSKELGYVPRPNVKRLSTEVEVSAGKLPSTPEIWVMEHAL